MGLRIPPSFLLFSPESLTQFPLNHLACSRLRQRRYGTESPWEPCNGKAGSCIPQQFRFRCIASPVSAPQRPEAPRPTLYRGSELRATSSTVGCVSIVDSSSNDDIFSPPLMMMSFRRSTTRKYPLRVNGRDISRVQPPIAKRFSARCGVAPVTHHHAVTPGPAIHRWILRRAQRQHLIDPQSSVRCPELGIPT